MAFKRQQQRHIGSPHNHRGKRSHHGIRWLSTSIYVLLGLMVLHLMLSEGDPRGVKPSVSGKTKKGADGGKKPSYRMPQHAEKVASISENTFFNKFPSDNEQTLKQIKSNTPEQKPADGTNTWGVKGGDGEKGSTSDDKESEEDSESRSFDTGEPASTDFNDSEEDMGENVQALKAHVDAVLMALKNFAQSQMEGTMANFLNEMEPYMSEISNMVQPLTKKYFPDDELTLKVEELVYDRLQSNAVTAVQDQVDLFLVQTSEEIDAMVAKYEDEGMEILQIDDKLQEFETIKTPELEEEIDEIIDGLRNALHIAVPDTALSTMESLLQTLGHPVSLKFDAYHQLELEQPLDETFVDEEIVMLAIEKVRLADANNFGNLDEDSSEDQGIANDEDGDDKVDGRGDSDEDAKGPAANDSVNEDEDDSAKDGFASHAAESEGREFANATRSEAVETKKQNNVTSVSDIVTGPEDDSADQNGYPGKYNLISASGQLESATEEGEMSTSKHVSVDSPTEASGYGNATVKNATGTESTVGATVGEKGSAKSDETKSESKDDATIQEGTGGQPTQSTSAPIGAERVVDASAPSDADPFDATPVLGTSSESNNSENISANGGGDEDGTEDEGTEDTSQIDATGGQAETPGTDSQNKGGESDSEEDLTIGR